jgi:hypothetical protein
MSFPFDDVFHSIVGRFEAMCHDQSYVSQPLYRRHVLCYRPSIKYRLGCPGLVANLRYGIML